MEIIHLVCKQNFSEKLFPDNFLEYFAYILSDWSHGKYNLVICLLTYLTTDLLVEDVSQSIGRMF